MKEDDSEDEEWEFTKTIIDNYSIYDDFENNLKNNLNFQNKIFIKDLNIVRFHVLYLKINF